MTPEIYLPSQIDASGNLPAYAGGGVSGVFRAEYEFDRLNVTYVLYGFDWGWSRKPYAAIGDAGYTAFPFDAVGSDLNNSIDGSAGYDVIYGLGGNDRLWGSRGNDKIFGGDGNDVINGGRDDNYLDGGAGNDLIQGGSDRWQYVRGADGRQVLDTSPNVDTIVDGAGNDFVFARGGNDIMIAGGGDDRYNGGAGFDTLVYTSSASAIRVILSAKIIDGLGHDWVTGVEKVIGTSFADTFDGTSKSDTFDGGAGSDHFRGRAGADTFTGGAGRDTFQWHVKDVVKDGRHLGTDHITDFHKGDKLDFHKLFANGLSTKAKAALVRVTDDSDGAHILVKIGTSYAEVAVLDEVHVTLKGLLADGAFIL